MIKWYMFQLLMVKEHLKEYARTVVRYAISRPGNARNAKGDCTEDALIMQMGAMHRIVTPTRSVYVV